MPSADRLARLFLLPLGLFVLASSCCPWRGSWPSRARVQRAGRISGACHQPAPFLHSHRDAGPLRHRDAGDARHRRRGGPVSRTHTLSGAEHPDRNAHLAARLSRRGGGLHDHLLAGRQGLIGGWTQALGMGRLVFAYSMAGLFAGYVYFSLPRVMVTLLAAVEKLDPALEEAARSLGARPPSGAAGCDPAWHRAFAHGLGCHRLRHRHGGLRHRLHARHPHRCAGHDHLYGVHAQREHRQRAALSIALGLITWVVLAATRNLAGDRVAAAG